MEMIDTRIYDDTFLLAKIFEHTELNKDEKERLYKHFEKRKKGEWLEHYSHEDGERDGVECSKCRTHYYFGGQLMNFCPNCGAEMRGEEDG